MRVVDPGHLYELDMFDAHEYDIHVLKFMKREGEGYPGNVGTYGGTNIQEVLRALIDRVKYLNKQIYDSSNFQVLTNLRTALMALEGRAAKRHGLTKEFIARKIDISKIEEYPTCHVCGHIVCKHKTHEGDTDGGGGRSSTNI